MLISNKTSLIIGIAVTLCALGSCSKKDKQNVHKAQVRFTGYVDPFIGTGAHGHTYPGATVPFGMVQLSPDNGSNGWDWVSGYHYSDSVITGFSHTHLSGTGIGDLADLLFMPVQRQRPIDLINAGSDQPDYQSHFSHDNEYAEPGYYSVYLDDNHVKAELTASERVGFHRYTFDHDSSAGIVIDLGFAINWDKPTDTYLKIQNDSTLVGYRKSTGWAKEQQIYFQAIFSQPISFIELVSDSVKIEGTEAQGSRVVALLTFDNGEQPIRAKVGVSTADLDGAKQSLQEIPHWDFDKAKQEASDKWEQTLSKILITSTDEERKKVFYTALYHSSLAPVIYSDLNHQYKGADGKVHQANGYTKYSVFSLWDTFRAAHPLYTITQPDRVDDFINSILGHYDEYGLLPVWELVGNETNTMTGYHAIPVIVDAWLKGFDGFDKKKAYEAMKKSAMQDIRGVDHYKKFGYVPADLENESVTKNLEYAYDDWCIAQIAKKLGKQDDYEYFIDRAMSYTHLFDPQTKFMRAKFSDGTWKVPFDPKFSSHRVDADYTEGNAWQHSWFVPHDVDSLIALMGGEGPFINMLDSLYSEDSEIHGDNISADISGLIGQYAHGNEPSHHIAYLYNFTGAPWKTQATVRNITDNLYTDEPTGLCGNEDCGQMSAWYIFSALGFYPVNPANGVYVIGSPVFEKSDIDLGDNKHFTIEAKHVNKKNKYIQSATLNGQPLERSYITHKELIKGGSMIFVMGPEPNKQWASKKKNYPYSGLEKE